MRESYECISTAVRSVVAAVEESTRAAGRVAPPRLVAVSKAQPLCRVQTAYQEGLRHFGENYVQELHSKATELQRLGGYGDIRWHFIGHLQGNKTKLLTAVPGLWQVETVHNEKMAQTLNRMWGKREGAGQPLRVLMQVNTSEEDNKHGCQPEECVTLARFIVTECPHLTFQGLMTVGRQGHPLEEGPNPDFQMLAHCSASLQQTLRLSRPLELSMGMTADFQHAISMGSTSIRVGTALFGRPPQRNSTHSPP